MILIICAVFVFVTWALAIAALSIMVHQTRNDTWKEEILKYSVAAD